MEKDAKLSLFYALFCALAIVAQAEASSFTLLQGTNTYVQPLQTPIRIDTGLGEKQAFGFSLNTHDALSNAPLSVHMAPASFADKVTWYVQGDTTKVLSVYNNEPIYDYWLYQPTALTMTAGTSRWFWFDVQGETPTIPVGQTGVTRTFTIVIQIGTETIEVPVEWRIWNARLPDRQLLPVKYYCGSGIFSLADYDLDASTLRKAETMIKVYAEAGGGSVDWTGAWPSSLRHITIEGTGVAVNSSAGRSQLRHDSLPNLDFSYYDPLIAIARRYGINRFETVMPNLADANAMNTLRSALGTDLFPVTEAPERVVGWLSAQLKRYAIRKGFPDVWAKVLDEPSVDQLALYKRIAAVAKNAGLHPFTTITAAFGTSAYYMNELNPLSDAWQVQFLSKNAFFDLSPHTYAWSSKTKNLAGATWAVFAPPNSGTRETWYTKVFSDEEMSTVDDVHVFEDGVELPWSSQSPFGNQQRGVFMTAGAIHPGIYVSPRDGADPNRFHAYTMSYRARQANADGPQATIDSTDEVWIYGGSSDPYQLTYGASRSLGWLAAYENVAGYGFWALFHFDPSEQIVKYDPVTNTAQFTPAYFGVRDGWQDGLYVRQWMRAQGVQAGDWGHRHLSAFDDVVKEGSGAPLTLQWLSGARPYLDIKNEDEATAFPSARRELFGHLAARASSPVVVEEAVPTPIIGPNPWRADRHQKSIHFSNMRSGTEIKLFTVSGGWVRTLQSSDGTVDWDLTNANGQKVASGIYLYILQQPGAKRQRGKLAIIR